MKFPIKVCAVCSEEFELKPGKPGFANRCPACSEPEATEPATKRRMDADERKTTKEANEARRQAMRNLLYRKDSQRKRSWLRRDARVEPALLPVLLFLPPSPLRPLR